MCLAKGSSSEAYHGTRNNAQISVGMSWNVIFSIKSIASNRRDEYELIDLVRVSLYLCTETDVKRECLFYYFGLLCSFGSDSKAHLYLP